jgi:cytochrome c-type biogenesis protein
VTEGWVDYLTGPWGFAFAFAAGVLSFLSPCVLPLVPAYIAHLTGATAAVESGRSERRAAVTHALLFVAGFGIVFTVVGASVGFLASVASDENQYAVRVVVPTLQKIGGVALIVMGLNLAGVIRIPFLYRTYSMDAMTSRAPVPVGAVAGGGTMSMGGGPGIRSLDYGRSVGLGSAFALGWTPCIGPVLGAILGLSIKSADWVQGAYLLLCYSLGLGVPFVAVSLAIVPATRFLKSIRGALPAIEIITGVMIIAVGVLLFFDELAAFNTYFSQIPFIDRFNSI